MPSDRWCAFESLRRQRAIGTLKTVTDQSGATHWEVLAESVQLLRPWIHAPLHVEPPTKGNAAAAAAAAAAAIAAAGAGMVGAGGDDRGVEEARERRIPAKFKALPPREAALAATRLLSPSQQRDVASAAAADGDLARIDALLSLGFDLSAPLDDYGQTAVFLSAANGHLHILRRLLALGLSPDCPSHGGSTAACAAAARGRYEALALLSEAGADLAVVGSAGTCPLTLMLHAALPPSFERPVDPRRALEDLSRAAGGGALTASPSVVDTANEATRGIQWYQRRGLSAGATGILPPRGAESARGGADDVQASCKDGKPPLPLPAMLYMHPARPLTDAAKPVRLVRLIDPSKAGEHAGAGACYIDGGVAESVLVALETLFHCLPLAERNRSTYTSNRIVDADRSYYSDTEGWVVTALREAVRAAGGGAPCEGEAMVNMRFLSYTQAGGGLPPHVDLSRTRRDGRTSLCTFILYLADCEAGGETVLLERLAQPSRVLAAVTPRRGRLLLFPHLCPHMAAEVVAEGLPKVLLRGEML